MIKREEKQREIAWRLIPSGRFHMCGINYTIKETPFWGKAGEILDYIDSVTEEKE